MSERNRFGGLLFASSLMILSLSQLTVRVASAQTFEVLHSFAGCSIDVDSGLCVGDSQYPDGALTLAYDGNLYGTTLGWPGGDGGAIYRVTPAGAVEVVFKFQQLTGVPPQPGFPNGCFPGGKLALGSDGALYGLAYQCGPNSGGTLFKLTTTGQFTKLHDFPSDPQNGYPSGFFQGDEGIALGFDDSVYGVINAGGDFKLGAIFRYQQDGTYTILHSFNGTDGLAPAGDLLRGSDGSLYGTTKYGGTPTVPVGCGYGCGVIYRVTPAGGFTMLHSFVGSEGGVPYGGLLEASDGSLYGTTSAGGPNVFDNGTVFRLAPDSTLTVVGSFSGTDSVPAPGLVQDADGNLYGQTGASFGLSTIGILGTVFRLAPGGAHSTLHAFTGSDGYQPMAGLALANGHLYGTTYYGGTSNFGVVFKLDLPSSSKGYLKLTKSFDAKTSGFASTFAVVYNCGVGDTTVNLAANASTTVGPFDTGSSCAVTEPTLPSAPAGWTFGTPSISSSPVTIAEGDQTAAVTVTITNSITRDTGSFRITKSTSNPDGATLPTAFNGTYDCGVGYTGNFSVGNGGSQTVNGIPTGNTCRVIESPPSPVANYTWGAATYTPSSVVISTNGSTFGITVGNSITRDKGTIVIVKNATPAQGSFAFMTTGVGYNSFTLTGATAGGGNQNSQVLPTGSYGIKEATQLGWTLTGIGGNVNSPYNCVVSGSGGSTGVGDLTTQTATITLKKGDVVTCTFENTGSGASRTQGFWATHPQLASIAWLGGTAFGHTFPGVATVLRDVNLCGRTLGLNEVMGGFWSNVSKTTTGAKRNPLDQARMQLLQQLLAAELNVAAFGSVPSGGAAMIDTWEAAYCGTNQATVQNAMSGATSFNSVGDSTAFTPGTSADSKNARTIANTVFWNVLP